MINRSIDKSDFFLRQVRSWFHERFEVGGQKVVLFKTLYQDYENYVNTYTNECVLAKSSFSRYINFILRDLMNAGRIRKIKRHPVRFENISFKEDAGNIKNEG